METPKGTTVKLPEGWKRCIVQRSSGKSAGKTDVYVFSPDRRKFRSRTEIEKFLQENELGISMSDFQNPFSRAGCTPQQAIRREPKDGTPTPKADSEKTPKLSKKHEKVSLKPKKLEDELKKAKRKDSEGVKSPAKKLKKSEGRIEKKREINPERKHKKLLPLKSKKIEEQYSIFSKGKKLIVKFDFEGIKRLRQQSRLGKENNVQVIPVVESKVGE